MKQFIVRMLCQGSPSEPAEFVFMYVFAESEQEAKQAVQDQMCYSITVNEVEEE
jgi:hypothetical protein